MKGARCRLNAHARDHGIHQHGGKQARLGTIVGECFDGQGWRVSWDGNKAKSTNGYHKSFIETVAEPVEMQSCEHCDGVCPLEDAVSSEGCYYCPKCWAEWLAEFDACAHEWRDYHDEHGDPGKICDRCSGFVNDEDMADLGLAT